MIDTAVILAAGQGSKLWPYCDTWPKAALPIANRPVLDWQIDALNECGVANVIVVAGRHSAQLRSVLSKRSNVAIVEQAKPDGTASALMKALPAISSDWFLVACGDTLFESSDIQSLMKCALAKNENAALIQPLEKRSPGEWLCANCADGKITRILGHPREASHRLCGVYALNRSIAPMIEANPGVMASVEVGNMPPGDFELAESISRFIQAGNSVAAVETQSIFEDIDKPWHYLDANDNWLNHLGSKLKASHIHPEAKVSEHAQIDGYAVVGQGSVIGPDVKIKGNIWVGENATIIDGPIIGSNAIIGDHSSVHEYCKIEPHTAIGNRCVAGHATEFGGVMMDGAYAYHYGEFWGVLGRSSDLGAATVCGTLRFDDQQTVHRVKGRREITGSPSSNASFLGDYVRTGVNAILMPGVKVGPYSVIGAGVILNEDVQNNSSVFVKQELIRSKWGPEKYGW